MKIEILLWYSTACIVPTGPDEKKIVKKKECFFWPRNICSNQRLSCIIDSCWRMAHLKWYLFINISIIFDEFFFSVVFTNRTEIEFIYKQHWLESWSFEMLEAPSWFRDSGHFVKFWKLKKTEILYKRSDIENLNMPHFNTLQRIKYLTS